MKGILVCYLSYTETKSPCFKVDGDGSGALWDSKKSDEAVHHLQSMIPLGRLGKPSDAASLVQFLLSPRARLAIFHAFSPKVIFWSLNCLLGT